MAALAVSLIVLTLAAPARAADDKVPSDPKAGDRVLVDKAAYDVAVSKVDPKALDRYLYSSLHDVINHGVDLYMNRANPRAPEECYQHFRQSLEALVPVLADHPDLQKMIKDGLDKVENDPDWRVKMAAEAEMPNPALAPAIRQKAFALRAVFSHVRAGLKPEGSTAEGPKGEDGIVDGKVMLDGRPLDRGKVTLRGGGNKAFAADVAADGSFKLAKVPPGQYRVTVTGTDIPAKYGSAETTPLTYEVRKGHNIADFPLKGEKGPATSETGNVQGTVKVDGKPLAKGKVTFTGEDSKAHTGDVTDGFYSLERLPTGLYAVTVSGTGVPAKFGDAKTSGLTYAVKKGENTHNIELKAEAKPEGDTGSIDGIVNMAFPKLLTAGKLTAHGKDGKTYTSDVKDGKYKLEGLPLGKYTVTITGEGVGAKYGDVKTTPLTLEIKTKGNNVPMSYGDVSEKPGDKAKPEDKPKPGGGPGDNTPPKVPEAIAVPAGNVVLAKIQADGVQIYEAKARAGGGFEWAPPRPDADLSADGQKLGKHYGSKDGPVWELEGDKITGELPPKMAAAAPGNIPWLLLRVKEFKPKEAAPPFTLTYVQRIDTEGGVAPAKAPEKADEEKRVKYKATYVFYIAEPKAPAGDVGSVSGKVAYKGQPVTGGTVTFAAKEGKATVSAAIAADGTYSAEKVPVGEYNIGIETESVKPKAGPGGLVPPKGGDKVPPAAADAPKYVKFPEKYADPRKSGLTFTVKKGKQTLDILLE
jgi:hypothetical protein